MSRQGNYKSAWLEEKLKEEKLKIDYEIQAKRKDSEKNLESWGCAFIVAFYLVFFVWMFIVAVSTFIFRS